MYGYSYSLTVTQHEDLCDAKGRSGRTKLLEVHVLHILAPGRRARHFDGACGGTGDVGSQARGASSVGAGVGTHRHSDITKLGNKTRPHPNLNHAAHNAPAGPCVAEPRVD